MEWLLYHLQSNRTRDNNTGKLMFTVACANESQVNNGIVPHFIKFHGNKQLFNTVFNLVTSLTFALKYDLSWAACLQDDMTSSVCVWKHGTVFNAPVKPEKCCLGIEIFMTTVLSLSKVNEE